MFWINSNIFISSFAINIILFLSAMSCILKEMVVLIAASVKESLIKEKLKSEINERKGDSL